MCLYCTVDDIFHVEYCRHLETNKVVCETRSFKLIENGADREIIYAFVSYGSAIVSIALSYTIFELFDVRPKQYRDLEI